MSTRKFQDGEKVAITTKFPGYLMRRWGLKVGDAVKVFSISYDGHYNVTPLNNSMSGNVRVPISALSKFVEKIQKNQFLDQIRKAEENIERSKAFIKEARAKIAFMDETGSDSFNENEFKAYQTLTIIEKGDLSKMEKAKAIAALIEKN